MNCFSSIVSEVLSVPLFQYYPIFSKTKIWSNLLALFLLILFFHDHKSCYILATLVKSIGKISLRKSVKQIYGQMFFKSGAVPFTNIS